MADIEVVSVGTIGPTGPATIAVGSVITARGALAVGNAAGTPIALAIGTTGKYLRSNGTDPSWTVIAAADLPTGIDAAKIGGGGVSTTEFDYLATVTSNVQTQLDGKSALAHAHTDAAGRGLFVDTYAASNATPSDNTSSITTFAVAADYSLTLPTGTWSVQAIGGVSLTNSLSNTVQFRVSIQGQDSGARSISTDDTVTGYWSGVDDDILGGLSGTIHVYVHFRSVASGTTYAQNPWLLVIASRTS